MAISRMSLLDLLHKAGVDGDVDFLREGLKVLAGVEVLPVTAEAYGALRQKEETDITVWLVCILEIILPLRVQNEERSGIVSAPSL